MDSRSFDRLARLLGGATDRRAGLKAALGAVLGGTLAADAAAEKRRNGNGKNRDAQRKGRGNGRDNAGAGANAEAGAEDVDAAKKKKVCRAVGATCKKAKNCCSGRCLKTLGQKKRKGVCQCLGEGETCSAAAACCGDLVCAEGRCLRREVPTGQACGGGEACEDPEAACVFYDPEQRSGRGNRRDKRDRQTRGEATRLCLLGGGSPCAKNEVCASLRCEGNVCTGQRFVPLGDSCVPGQDRCADSRARCGAYATGSGGPAGTFCLLANGEVCDADPECRVNDCNGGFCGRAPVETGAACNAAQDTCRNPNATCTRYADGTDNQTYCLLANGEICDAASQCVVQECIDGTCGGSAPAPVPTGDECGPGTTCAAADASCTVYANVPDETTRCLVRNGGACEGNADCVSSSCERSICVDLQPGVCDVCKDGSCQFETIADAIEAGLDDITIQGGAPGDSGTWYLGVDLPGGDRKLTLRTCTSAQATISAGGAGRVMSIATGGDVTFINIRIIDGDSTSYNYNGGGLLVNPGGKLTLLDSEVENCRASGYVEEQYSFNGGGGVMVLAGELEMIGGAMRGNSGEGPGGALLLVDAKARLSGVTFTGNRSNEDGGAILAKEFGIQQPTLDIEDCVFQQNEAGDDGGAIALEHSGASIRDSQFTGNQAPWYGGAIYFECYVEDGATVSGCTLSDNSSQHGGGFFNYGQGVMVVNSTVTNNRASREGGGIKNNGGLTLLNVGVTGNTAGETGGGVLNEYNLALLGTTEIRSNSAPVAGGLYNYAPEDYPEDASEVICSIVPTAPDVCGNTGGDCANMELQSSCDGVCKEGACG